MRKLLLILLLLPALTQAKPQLHDEPPCGGMPPPPMHPMSADDKEQLPGFLHQLNLSDKQQAEIKTLGKAQRAEIDAKLENLMSLGKEIHQLSFSNDYSNVKIQALLDKAEAIHKEIALQKSRLDNAIFKRLNDEQQKKLQNYCQD